jgi:hypothetical protein
MKRNIILSGLLFLSMLVWQCSKQPEAGLANTSLRAALNTNTEKLSQAVNAIASSRGYEILNLNSSLKSEFLMDNAIFKDSITLNAIKGIYEYKPVSFNNWCFNCLSKLFTKTGDTSIFIVKLPSEKIFHPNRFQTVVPADSTLKNNFVISASAYNFYYTMGFLHNYKLTAGIAVNDTSVGNIDIQSDATSVSNFTYASSFTFPDGYNLKSSATSGDTASSSFSLSSTTETLLKETVYLIKTQGSKFRERQYILDIGNVEFKKSSATDSFTVSVGGVLQTKAKIQIIDQVNSTGEISIFRNRDIQITFDDGTTTTLSALVGPSINLLRGLSASLQDVYFATNIVNYIAWNVYKNRIH